VEVYLHTFLNLASHGDEWSASCSGRYFVGKETSVSNELNTAWRSRGLWTFLEAKNVLPRSGIEARVSDWSAITIVTVCTEMICRLKYRKVIERKIIFRTLIKPDYSGFPIEIRNQSEVQFYQQGLHVN
jgi:hypothetical protein